MIRYILARVVGMVPAVLVLVLFVVILIRLLPGNAVDIMLTEQVRAGDTSRADLEHRLGLDKSIPQDYVDYTVGLVQGDLGKSVWSQKPVTELLWRRLGVTLELAAIALVMAIAAGVPIGVISAVRQNSVIDYVLRSVSILGLAVPNFAIATMVLVLPTIWWHWSPSLIYTAPSDGLWDHVSQFFIPAAVLSLSLSATIMRLTRTAMLEVMRLDHIRTARAKGLPEATVVYRHALRNALIPVVSLIGVQVAFLLSGAVIIENVFALPGVGRLLVEAVATRDYPLVQGITVVAGLLVIATNLVVDLSYGVLDPRVKV